ncbi:MAG: TadE family protein [Pseudomonadota bacterium]
MKSASRSVQVGSTSVEFALVFLIFLTFVLAVTDFGRMLFMWNAATEATRAGARYAVVCDDTTSKAEVLTRMQRMLPQISDISLVWEDELGNTACNSSTCMGVTVTIVGLNYQWISPIAGAVKLAPSAMPQFKTFLTREIMRQDPNSATICQ